MPSNQDTPGLKSVLNCQQKYLKIQLFWDKHRQRHDGTTSVFYNHLRRNSQTKQKSFTVSDQEPWCCVNVHVASYRHEGPPELQMTKTKWLLPLLHPSTAKKIIAWGNLFHSSLIWLAIGVFISLAVPANSISCHPSCLNISPICCGAEPPQPERLLSPNEICYKDMTGNNDEGASMSG